ncbi:MAG: SDR family NAD(P)-dependent oxidoreductase [Rubricoccaceae bacterium]|nr:SDR family NAD(P)-dependent oxidoreductase [Rubricoccaceae bacterium]
MLPWPPDPALAGLRLVVTGGSRGVGGAVVEAAHAAGATVGIGHLQSQEPVQASAARDPERLIPLRFDVADAEATEEALRAFAEHAGGLDALVCCAGIATPGLLTRQPVDRLAREIAVNLVGTLVSARAALPHLAAAGGGTVVTVSSAAARMPQAGQTAYAASKGGVEAFTRALATEAAAQNVRAVCVRLGLTETNMLAEVSEAVRTQTAARALTPDVASPACIARHLLGLLAAGDRLTGSVVDLSGGYGHAW